MLRIWDAVWRPPELAASVPFYGRQAAAGDVARIEAPLLIHYAELDERINAGWPDYEAAAELAWDRTIDFFNEHLK